MPEEKMTFGASPSKGKKKRIKTESEQVELRIFRNWHVKKQLEKKQSGKQTTKPKSKHLNYRDINHIWMM